MDGVTGFKRSGLLIVPATPAPMAPGIVLFLYATSLYEPPKPGITISKVQGPRFTVLGILTAFQKLLNRYALVLFRELISANSVALESKDYSKSSR